MYDETPDDVLTTKAVAGDADALTALLWEHYGRLLASIKRKLPQEFRGIEDEQERSGEVSSEQVGILCFPHEVGERGRVCRQPPIYKPSVILGKIGQKVTQIKNGVVFCTPTV